MGGGAANPEWCQTGAITSFLVVMAAVASLLGFMGRARVRMRSCGDCVSHAAVLVIFIATVYFGTSSSAHTDRPHFLLSFRLLVIALILSVLIELVECVVRRLSVPTPQQQRSEHRQQALREIELEDHNRSRLRRRQARQQERQRRQAGTGDPTDQIAPIHSRAPQDSPTPHHVILTVPPSLPISLLMPTQTLQDDSDTTTTSPVALSS